MSQMESVLLTKTAKAEELVEEAKTQQGDATYGDADALGSEDTDDSLISLSGINRCSSSQESFNPSPHHSRKASLILCTSRSLQFPSSLFQELGAEEERRVRRRNSELQEILLALDDHINTVSAKEYSTVKPAVILSTPARSILFERRKGK